MPVHARHVELSVISSIDQSRPQATTELLDLALRAARLALDIDLSQLETRSDAAKTYLPVFPGEHYRLLAALVKSLSPTQVVEIGTYTGLSALAMLSQLDEQARLTTFDVVPWTQFEGAALRTEDFSGGRLEQRIGDLADRGYFEQNSDVLSSSQLIFIDGPKDGKFEPAFVRQLLGAQRTRPALLVFDDIRVWNMLGAWADLDLPKLDLTSFGHWSGTGLSWLAASTSMLSAER